jgi:antitoxin VapB
MAINLKNPEAERLVRELVAVTGESLTDAITESVRERLQRERKRRGVDCSRSWERVRAIQQRVRERPLLDPRSADDIVGYDEHGVPS